MKRHGNLFNKIVDLDNIRQAYLKARRGKGWMKSVKVFEEDLENNLIKIQKSLINKTFTTSEYKNKYLYEPKFREIFIVPFNPDRIVQHALMAVVEPIWDSLLISNTCSCRKGKGVQRAYELALKYSRQNKYYLKCDISKFYPSIDHDIIFEVIRQKIKCKDTLWLLSDIIYAFGRQYGTKCNTPIGNYTSQWFGNLYLDTLDQKAVHEYKLDYVRYCDDFIFFSNNKEQLRNIQKALPSLLWDTRKLTLSKCELFPCTSGLDFMGYRFFPDYVLLRKRVTKRMKTRFKTLGNKKKKISSQIASAHGLLKRCNSYHLRNTLGIDKLAKLCKLNLR